MPAATEAELQRRLCEAQEAIRARDEFLAIAAHELRSPLHALALRLAALERMAAASGSTALQQELQRTGRSVDRYVRRAVTLLDLSRIQSGQLQPRPQWLDANALVEQLVDAYRDEARFHQASLHGRCESPLQGYWDPHMIEQVLANLVSNAIKYGKGTPVLLRARAQAPQLACFEVSDRGPGIAQADRTRVFEKFERVVGSTRDQGGFGVGLWIVGRMVAAHQGSIEVASRPGGGTLFRVLLPLCALAGSNNEHHEDR